jgi:hypothetical protein
MTLKGRRRAQTERRRSSPTSVCAPKYLSQRSLLYPELFSWSLSEIIISGPGPDHCIMVFTGTYGKLYYMFWDRLNCIIDIIADLIAVIGTTNITVIKAYSHIGRHHRHQGNHHGFPRHKASATTNFLDAVKNTIMHHEHHGH